MRLRLRRLIAPRVPLAFQAATRYAFPLGFRRQAVIFAGARRKPCAVRRRVKPTDTCDWLIGMIEACIAPAGRSLTRGFVEKVLVKPVGYCIAPNGEAINPHAM